MEENRFMTDDLTLNMDAYLPLRDVVFNTLREAILKGELKPGERLMELQLAAKLGDPHVRAGGLSGHDSEKRCGSRQDDRKGYGGCASDP